MSIGMLGLPVAPWGAALLGLGSVADGARSRNGTHGQEGAGAGALNGGARLPLAPVAGFMGPDIIALRRAGLHAPVASSAALSVATGSDAGAGAGGEAVFERGTGGGGVPLTPIRNAGHAHAWGQEEYRAKDDGEDVGGGRGRAGSDDDVDGDDGDGEGDRGGGEDKDENEDGDGDGDIGSIDRYSDSGSRAASNRWDGIPIPDDLGGLLEEALEEAGRRMHSEPILTSMEAGRSAPHAGAGAGAEIFGRGRGGNGGTGTPTVPGFDWGEGGTQLSDGAGTGGFGANIGSEWGDMRMTPWESLREQASSDHSGSGSAVPRGAFERLRHLRAPSRPTVVEAPRGHRAHGVPQIAIPVPRLEIVLPGNSTTKRG